MKLIEQDITVIIPCFNAERYIGKAIESCFNQNGANIEILVINDGSTDRSQDIIESFGDKVILINQSNKGGSAARNTGLRNANGRYIKFLDADDYLEPGILPVQLSRLKEYGADKPVAVYGDFNLVNEQGVFIRKKIQPIIAFNNNGLADLIELSIITASTIYRKEDLVKIGGFNEVLRGNQEHELNIRLFLSGVMFLKINDLVFSHRDHKSESRISCRKWPVTDPMFMWRLIDIYESLLGKNNIPIEGRISAAMATRMISSARSLADAGNRQLAEEHFQRALILCPGKSFRIGKRYWLTRPYIFMTRIVGFYSTERIYASIIVFKNTILKFRD